MSKQPPVTQHVQPQPAPASWEVMDARAADGSAFVVLAFHTVTGTSVQFLDAGSAKGLAAALEQRASQISSVLIVAKNPLITPPGP